MSIETKVVEKYRHLWFKQGCNTVEVELYWNLHRKMWSMRANLPGIGKRVIGHTNYVWLTDTEFKVSEAGRQRVIRDKKKNVHAYAKGKMNYYGAYDGEVIAQRWEDDDVNDVGFYVEYNPYYHKSFMKVAWWLDTPAEPLTYAAHLSFGYNGEVVGWV